MNRVGLLLLLLAGVAIAEDEEPGPLDPERLEKEEVTIGRIVLEREDVFDLSNPKENNWFYRLLNKLHIITKERVIENQLLFEPGQPYKKRLIEETERILRRNTYLYEYLDYATAARRRHR